MHSKRVLSQVHFDIVGGCQLQCVGCPNSKRKAKITFIKPDLFENCLRNINVDHIETFRLFNYGEPLLHPNLPAIGEKIAKQKYTIDCVEISTNAQCVDWELFEDFIRLGILNRIAISCDGNGTKTSYESLRPPAKWEKLLFFFERVSSLKTTIDPNLQIITRTIIENLKDMDNWNKVLADYPIKPEFRGWKYLSGSECNMTGREIKIPDKACFFVELKDQLYVNHRGDIIPCCAHPQAAVIGNLRKYKYPGRYNLIKREKFEAKLNHKRKRISICNSCEFGPQYSRGSSAGQNLPV